MQTTVARSCGEIEGVRRRVNRAIAVEAALAWIVGGTLLLGAVLVGVRLVRPDLAGWCFLGVVPIAAVAARAAVRARREFFEEGEIAAWLDLRAGAGGRILTYQRFEGRASGHLEVETVRVPRLRGGRFLARLGPALLFLVACALVPVERFVEKVRPLSNPLADRDLDLLEERLEDLGDRSLLDEETLEALREEVAALEDQQADEPFSEQGLEAIDALEERVENLARESEQAAGRASEALEALEEALAEGADAESLAPQREALERALADLGARGGLDGLPPEVREQLGMGDPGELGKDWKLPSDPQALQKALEALGEAAEEALTPMAFGGEGEEEGSGQEGINRGPGATPLEFGEPSPELSEALKEQTLPPGMATDLENAELVGVSGSAPEVDPQPGGGSGNAGSLGAGPGGTVGARATGVRERRVLKRYFSEE